MIHQGLTIHQRRFSSSSSRRKIFLSVRWLTSIFVFVFAFVSECASELETQLAAEENSKTKRMDRDEAVPDAADHPVEDKEKVDEVVEDLKCRWCGEICSDPLYLHCSHSICSSCLGQLPEQVHRIECSQCQITTEVRFLRLLSSLLPLSRCTMRMSTFVSVVVESVGVETQRNPS